MHCGSPLRALGSAGHRFQRVRHPPCRRCGRSENLQRREYRAPVRGGRTRRVARHDRGGPRRHRTTGPDFPDPDPSPCEPGAHGAKTRAPSSRAGNSSTPSANRWPAAAPAASTLNVSGATCPCSISTPCATWAKSSHRALRSSGNACSERWRFHPIWNRTLCTSWTGSTAAYSKPTRVCNRSRRRCPAPRGSLRAIGKAASICGWSR